MPLIADQALVLPMFAMVVLVLLVSAVMLLSRVFYVRSGKVRLSYFRVMEAKGELPDPMMRLSRNYINLFEMPVLFYAACITGMLVVADTSGLVTTAWIFVASRYAHSVIHTTYNNVMHRMVAFFVGVGAVMAMWFQIVLAA